jgi:hypothetical protein
MFAKQPVESSVADQPNKSRFQLILDDLNIAHKRLDHAAHLFSTLIVDVEKGINFVDKFRHDLTEAIQDAGGTAVETAHIEEAIAEFLPKRVQASDGR